MQHLEDQADQIKAYFNGAGDPAYGPIPAYPKSPFGNRQRPGRGRQRGVVLHDAGTGAVAAGTGRHLGLEDQHLGDRTAGLREPDPARQLTAVLVHDQELTGTR